MTLTCLGIEGLEGRLPAGAFGMGLPGRNVVLPLLLAHPETGMLCKRIAEINCNTCPSYQGYAEERLPPLIYILLYPVC